MAKRAGAPTTRAIPRKSAKPAKRPATKRPAAKKGAAARRRRAGPLDRLRAICLALPEAEERETWETPTFRVRDRIFAMAVPDGERPAFWCKAPAGSQQVLVGADADRFFVPPYVGHKGWVGMRLDRRVDWKEVEAIVRRSYSLVAPKRLAVQVR